MCKAINLNLKIDLDFRWEIIPVDKVIGIDIVIRVVRNTTPNAVVW